MPRVEIINAEGTLLGIIDDENCTVEKTEAWKQIQAAARKRRSKAIKSTGTVKKPGKPWSTGY